MIREILRPAPIFDNGLSFMATLDKNDFCNIANSLDKDISYFELQFDEQLKIFIEPRHAKNLKNSLVLTLKDTKNIT